MKKRPRVASKTSVSSAASSSSSSKHPRKDAHACKLEVLAKLQGGPQGGIERQLRWDKRMFASWAAAPKETEIPGTNLVVAKVPLSNAYEEHTPGATFTTDELMDSLMASQLPCSAVVDAEPCQERYMFDRKEILDEWDVKRIPIPIDRAQIGPSLAEPMFRFVPPSRAQVAEFIKRAESILLQDSASRIVVLSTFGFNRAGVIVVSFMVEKMRFKLKDALTAFAKHRPPGIYARDCLQALQRRFGADTQVEFPAAPPWDSFAVECKAASNEKVVLPPIIGNPQQPVIEKFPVPAVPDHKKKSAVPKPPAPWQVGWSKREKRHYFHHPETGRSVWKIEDCK